MPGFAGAAPSISAQELEEAVRTKRSSVPEFQFITEYAKANGMRVWLFGGTAASFAHYAKWDVLRKKGDARYQPNRFDYDYTNIYRSNQDLDIVIDAPPAKAHDLQALLAAKFPHLQGQKSAWEVRLLREGLGEKEAILGNPDFSNQHTDSHSVGMIELTDASEPLIRDLREWSEARPTFLQDVLQGRLHYYFSNTHGFTARARKGLNPPIISVVRYYIKAFQFELSLDPKDEAIVKSIIEKFDPRKMTEYEQSWMEKNAPKLFQNAVNIEYAWDTLERIGLRRKLLAIGQLKHENSVAWWMNKEPLRSKNVGDGLGRTAKSLGIETVAHETKSFEAYESITRAHTGDPNVLISRDGASGEAAMFGDGFYTAKGKSGAIGSKITIRFTVDPNAREGTDFIRHDDYFIFRNKRALRVIPESLNWGFREYVNFLTAGSIDVNERAMLEKLKRRLNARMAIETTAADFKWFDDIVKTEIFEKETKNSALIKGWFEMRRPLDGGVDRKLVMDLLKIASEERTLAPLLKEIPPPKKPFRLSFSEYLSMRATISAMEASGNSFFVMNPASLADIKALGKTIKESQRQDQYIENEWLKAAYFSEISMTEILDVLSKGWSSFTRVINNGSFEGGKRPTAKQVRRVTYVQYIRLLEMMPTWAGNAPEANRTLAKLFVPAQPTAEDLGRLAGSLKVKVQGLHDFRHNVAQEWLERVGPLAPETQPFYSRDGFVTSLQVWLNDEKAPKFEVTLLEAFELMKHDFAYVQPNFGLRLKIRRSAGDAALLKQMLMNHASTSEPILAVVLRHFQEIEISTEEARGLLVGLAAKAVVKDEDQKLVRLSLFQNLKSRITKASDLTVEVYLSLVLANDHGRLKLDDFRAMEANLKVDARAVRDIDERMKKMELTIPYEEALGRLWLKAHNSELEARSQELLALLKRRVAGQSMLVEFLKMHEGLPEWAESKPEFWRLLETYDPRVVETLFATERNIQRPIVLRRIIQSLDYRHMSYVIKTVFGRYRAMDADSFLLAIEKHGPYVGSSYPWEIEQALASWKTHDRMKKLMSANSMWKRKMTLENVLLAIKTEREHNLTRKPTLTKKVFGTRTCNALFVR